MGTGLFSIGVSGIGAAQLGLLATEHNIVNANTVGYTRQRAIQATNLALGTGSGSIGQGVHVETIDRLYDRFLTAQVTTAQTRIGSLDAYYGQIQQIDNLLADPSAGLTPALQDFFTGVQQVAANPSLLSSRQSMISATQTLVNRFHSVESRLGELSEQINGKIQDTVAAVNSLATQVADVNQRIIISKAQYGHPPNDLLDERDRLVAELNQEIKVSTVGNSDGSISLFIGSGQQLVTGMQAMELTALASSEDNSRIVVGLKTVSGTVIEFPESLLAGGRLEGLTRFRSEALDPAYNELGRVAASLALTFNAQHALGQDLLGQSIVDGTTFNPEYFDLDQVKPTVIPNRINQGDAVVAASFVRPPPAAGTYELGYELAAGVHTFTLTRQSDGQTWTQSSASSAAAALTGLDAAVAGESLDLSSAGSLTSGQTATVYGAAASTANFFTNLTTSDYRLSFDGSDFSLTRLSDKKTWANADFSALAEAVAFSEGFILASGNPAAMEVGDSFLIQPTRNAARNIALNADVAADPRLIAAGVPFRTSAASDNTGSGTITAGRTIDGYQGFVTPVFNAETLTLGFTSGSPDTVSFTAGLAAAARISVTTPDGQTTIYDTATPIPYTQGMEIRVGGISFALSGRPDHGDTFTIAPNPAAVADGRNVLSLAQLQIQNTMSGGKGTYQTAYAEMVSRNGIKTRELKIMSEAQQTVLEQAQAERDALSGVNLDEEAANLLKYQQAYQASAKILEIGKTVFDTLLQLG